VAPEVGLWIWLALVAVENLLRVACLEGGADAAMLF
jgi:hypothetical protein